jgi:hypothetical protein
MRTVLIAIIFSALSDDVVDEIGHGWLVLRRPRLCRTHALGLAGLFAGPLDCEGAAGERVASGDACSSECFFHGSKLEALAEESSLVARVGIGAAEHELPLGVAVGPCLWLAGYKVGDLALLNVGDDDAAHVADGIPLC